MVSEDSAMRKMEVSIERTREVRSGRAGRKRYRDGPGLDGERCERSGWVSGSHWSRED
jgi:hypothetical protein